MSTEILLPLENSRSGEWADVAEVTGERHREIWKFGGTSVDDAEKRHAAWKDMGQQSWSQFSPQTANVWHLRARTGQRAFGT